MKINTLTIKKIIKEEIENVMNPQQIPTPESMGFERLELSVAEGTLKDLENMFDLNGLMRFIGKNFNIRTLEESERLSRKKKKAMIRRRRKSREQEAPDLETEPVTTKTPAERIKENVDIIRNGSAIERTGGLYMENLSALQEEIKHGLIDKTLAPDVDVELIQRWIEIFLYEASSPILKKYLPNITKFTINSYDKIIEFIKDQELKAKLKAKEAKEGIIKKATEIYKSPNFFLGATIIGFPPVYIAILISMFYIASVAPVGIGGFAGAVGLGMIPFAAVAITMAMQLASKADRNR